VTLKELQRLAEVRQLIASGEAKKRRILAGFSLSEVAGPCHVDTSTVWRWEEGIRTPRGQMAQRYWQVLTMMRPRAGAS
jgi:DNA-binding transcriptional regulator YiaG